MVKQQAALARVFERTEALIEHLGLRNVGEVVLDPCHVLGFGFVKGDGFTATKLRLYVLRDRGGINGGMNARVAVVDAPAELQVLAVDQMVALVTRLRALHHCTAEEVDKAAERLAALNDGLLASVVELDAAEGLGPAASPGT